ncbi:MAG: 16S rRNA (adenine(1518)-N(6)/adenine(1519)-N(6))-dimethyltransferase RsmA [bacterium]|nr:16S rRNA (adenine(1518)-N(6)/adenine(1519)-N(6))-dimethyltransferase RsmA [bacterium]
MDAIRRRLEDAGVKPSKRKGQNFLKDANLARAIVTDARIKADEFVIEVGPGLGALTEHLLTTQKAGLLLVELEADFCRKLQEDHPALMDDSFVNSDIRDVALADILPNGVEHAVVVSNVPYSISTDMVLWVLRNSRYISRASFLLQREFSERIASPAGTRECSSLSILTSYQARVSLGRIVSGDAFVPRAGVESRMLFIEPHRDFNFDVAPQSLEPVLRASFLKRRKTIHNSLASAGFGSKSEVGAYLFSAGIDPVARAESLQLSQFLELTRVLIAAGVVG